MGDRYRVVVSPVAADMLVEHVDFLSRVSEHAADQLIADFEKIIESLRESPERGPWFKQYPIGKPRYRKILLSKRYLILYKIEADTVYIEYTVDCRRDNSWLMF